MSEFESCEKCVYKREGMDGDHCSRCVHNCTDQFKAMTNADRIRNMTDEELAELLEECINRGYMDSSITPKDANGFNMDMLEWLQVESEV